MRLSTIAAAALMALATISNVSAQGAATNASPSRPVVYPDAEQFTIASRFTGRTYTISVAKPRLPHPIFSLYHIPAPARFPAVFTPDADFGFFINAQLAQLMEGGEDVPPFYSIGIGYGTTDFIKFMELRQKDLTPTVDKSAPPIIAAWGMGGSEAFFQFIQQELKPELARRYPIDLQQTTISGLSHGGLFVLWSLFTHPEAFQNYLALDPANWDDYVGERIEAGFAARRVPLDGKRLYIGLESPDYADPRLQGPTTAIRDRWLKFCDTVKARAYEGLAFKCEAHKGESHFSVAGPGSTHGLRWIMPMNAVMPAQPGTAAAK